MEVKGELMIFSEDAELNIKTLWCNWPLDLFQNKNSDQDSLDDHQ